MTDNVHTRDVVRQYWLSWQTQRIQDMDETIAEDYVLYLYGQRTPTGKADLLAESFERGSLWKNVQMLAEQYSENKAAIYYQGTDTANDRPIFACEFLELNSQKRIFKNQTMVYPRPSNGSFQSIAESSNSSHPAIEKVEAVISLPIFVALRGICLPCNVAANMLARIPSLGSSNSAFRRRGR